MESIKQRNSSREQTQADLVLSFSESAARLHSFLEESGKRFKQLSADLRRKAKALGLDQKGGQPL